MIIRDLFRCPTEDLHKAIATSGQPVLRRGVVEPSSAIEPADVAYLVAHPDFDPSLSHVVYDGAEPAAFLVSRFEGPVEHREVVCSLFGGKAERAREMVLDAAMEQWRKEKAKRARKGVTGLLGSEPRLAEDAAVVDLLKARGFEQKALGAEMVADLKKLPTPTEAVSDSEARLRQKGFVVRPAQPDEVAVVARQFQPRHTGMLTKEYWNYLAYRLRAEALLVAELRRQLIGYAAYLGWTLDGDSPVLGPTFVEPVHRATNIEDILLRQTLATMKHAGKARVRVFCGTDKVAVYQRAGFAVTAYFCRDLAAELI